jgi:hypothetical protein
VFLHGERGWQFRWLAAVVVAAVAGWVVIASTADAAASRHYEQVSPADKGQGDIVGDGETIIASKLGDAVAFSSRTPFGDEVGSGTSGQTQYVARRTATDWQVHAVTPTPRPDSFQTFFTPTKVQTFSDDLRTAIVWGYDLPGATGDAPNRNAIYVEDMATRGLQPITVSQVDPIAPLDFLNTTNWGLSADAQHMAFVSTTQLLPGAAATPAPNVYQWDSGVLNLAGVLPDGSVPSGGSDVVPQDYRGAMSSDGTRLVFTASPVSNPQLFMRIDERKTVWISQPELRGSPPLSQPDPNDPASDPAGVFLQAVTPDGRNVFFVTDSSLLSADRNTGPDLYRWTDSADPAHDSNLTLISQNGNVPANNQGTAVAGVSDDGKRVYYQTQADDLIVWNDGVSTLVSPGVQRDAGPGRSLAATGSAPGYGRVTPDGTWIAFLSASTQANAGVHALTGQVTNGHYEMYLYSLSADRLTCVSCPSDDATSDVSVFPSATSGLPRIFNDAIRPQFLSDQGRVFFATADALVPEDRNGVDDVYEYDSANRTLTLVSSGKGSDPADFADASADGGDVFVVTRQQLVSSDHDNLVDLYDATVRPALPIVPETQTRDCQGDTCQDSPTVSPSRASLGSLSFDGPDTSALGKALATPRRAAFRGAAGFLRVTLSTPGRLRWSGRGVKAGSVRRSRSGHYTVRVRLDRRARAQLRRTGRYVTRVRLTYVLTDGGSVSSTIRVTFRAAAKKGR